MDRGAVPVRHNPEGTGEVVWGRRIDPARAVILNVPLPESGFRFGDIVLHDGEPVGERTSSGRTYPVFNVLQRWETSALPTCQVNVVAPGPSDADDLETLFTDEQLGAEDWTGRIRHLCKQCSEGSPHEHTGSSDGPWQTDRQFGIGAEPTR
jgi:hypothetical protein